MSGLTRSATAFPDQSLNCRSRFANGNSVRLCRASPFDFCDALCESLATDGDAERNSDQVSILELEARSLVAVIHEHIDPSVAELAVELIGNLHDLGIGDVEWDELNGIRRGLKWPDDAVFVVTGFNDGGDDAGDTDSVATHDDGMGLFLSIDIGGLQGDAVFCAKFEDVANFDAVDHLQCASAFGTGVTTVGVAEVEGGGHGEMESRDDTCEVCIAFIGTDDSGRDLSGIMIDEIWALQTNRTGKSNRSTGHFENAP